MANLAQCSSPHERQTNERPIPLACTECRKKHLRCDTTSPPCTRCVKRRLPCAYTPSRRGHRARPNRSSASRPDDVVCTTQHFQTRSTQSVALLTRPSSSATSERIDSVTEVRQFPTPATALQAEGSTLSSDGVSAPIQPLSKHDEEHLVNLYYSRFHRTHPLLLPRHRYGESAFPLHLRLVIQLIGSVYAPGFSRCALQSATDSALTNSLEHSVTAVQSLLLRAISLHADAEQAKAVPMLARASEMAIELGLNRAEFAATHGMGDPFVKESLRRTWWELFVVDGFFAALHQQTGFACNNVQLTAQLPCEDSSVPGPPVTLDDFDLRFFAATEQSFASACYRIDSIRILARVLAVSKGETGPDDVQAVDNAIAAWKLHLPPAKASIIDQYGEVDQIILQAHTFIYTASIILHFPRSELPLKVPTAADIACATMIQASPTSAQHATKAISASKDMSDLAGLPVRQHSPLLVCSLVPACIVQLSACSAHSHDCTMYHRDRVALMTGMLKCMGRHLEPQSNGMAIIRDLNKIASGVFTLQKPCSDAVAYDEGFDMDTIFNNVSWLDLFPAFPADRSGQEGSEMWRPL